MAGLEVFSRGSSLGPDKGLSNQVAVVTGASRGIGQAIALALAERGVTLCMVGRDMTALKKAAPPSTGGQNVQLYEADLSIDSDVDSLASSIQRDFGRVDILVLAAGMHYMGTIERTPVEQLDLLYRANVRAPYMLTRALLPVIKAGPGQIVFINSSVGIKSKAQVGHFASTQHALRALTDSLRDEINPSGVRVMSVFPGRTATPRTQSVFEQEGREYKPGLLLQSEDVAAVVIHALSLPRTAEVTEVSVRPLVKSY
jgi:NADP-dependent 3-hydroxy acid dehydrogenase YdfG